MFVRAFQHYKKSGYGEENFWQRQIVPFPLIPHRDGNGIRCHSLAYGDEGPISSPLIHLVVVRHQLKAHWKKPKLTNYFVALALITTTKLKVCHSWVAQRRRDQKFVAVE